MVRSWVFNSNFEAAPDYKALALHVPPAILYQPLPLCVDLLHYILPGMTIKRWLDILASVFHNVVGQTTTIISRHLQKICTLWRWTRGPFQSSPWPLISFPTDGCEIIEDFVVLEEENTKTFSNGDFYPVAIGDLLDSRYQVVGKLGFGISSTVWLARDLW